MTDGEGRQANKRRAVTTALALLRRALVALKETLLKAEGPREPAAIDNRRSNGRKL